MTPAHRQVGHRLLLQSSKMPLKQLDETDNGITNVEHVDSPTHTEIYFDMEDNQQIEGIPSLTRIADCSMCRKPDIQRENKKSGCVPGTGSTPQSETRQAPRKLRGNINATPKAHVADMTVAPASIRSLHAPMEKQHGN
jgi:hypothetical protein